MSDCPRKLGEEELTLKRTGLGDELHQQLGNELHYQLGEEQNCNVSKRPSVGGKEESSPIEDFEKYKESQQGGEVVSFPGDVGQILSKYSFLTSTKMPPSTEYHRPGISAVKGKETPKVNKQKEIAKKTKNTAKNKIGSNQRGDEQDDKKKTAGVAKTSIPAQAPFSYLTLFCPIVNEISGPKGVTHHIFYLVQKIAVVQRKKES